MATIRFNHVDDFSESLAKKIESEKATNRQFKATITLSGNTLVKFSNSMKVKAQAISEKFDCKLQDGCMMPAGTGWKFDSKGEIIGEQPATILVNYIFHGENCIQCCEELESFYNQVR